MKEKFEIDTSIYALDFLNQAIQDFSEYSEIVLNWNYLTISWDTKEDIEEVFNELMNYCVWLINQ